MESELLHTYSKVDPFDVLVLCVRVAVLTAVTLTVPIVLFPVRRAIQHMLFQEREFSWLRHALIAAGLLTCINLLVIFAPNILGIFGVIGEELSLLCVEAGYCPRGMPFCRSWQAPELVPYTYVMAASHVQRVAC